MSIKIIAENKKARFDFEIVDTYEAGLVLMGSEVKSLRDGACQLKDSYVSFQQHEAFLQKAHIAVYKAASYNGHEPERLRKLLLHESELNQLQIATQEKGLTCIPLKIYFKKGIVKVELGLARGKKKGDKRQDLKTRDANREIDRQMRKTKA